MFPRRSIVMVAAGAALLLASPVVGQEIGPANGSLVIVGGAMRDTAIVRRFLDLAGGTDAPIVVIPTAGTADRYAEQLMNTSICKRSANGS